MIQKFLEILIALIIIMSGFKVSFPESVMVSIFTLIGFIGLFAWLIKNVKVNINGDKL